MRYDHGLPRLGFSTQQLARYQVLAVLDEVCKASFIAHVAIDVGIGDLALCEHCRVACGTLFDTTVVMVDPCTHLANVSGQP